VRFNALRPRPLPPAAIPSSSSAFRRRADILEPSRTSPLGPRRRPSQLDRPVRVRDGPFARQQLGGDVGRLRTGRGRRRFTKACASTLNGLVESARASATPPDERQLFGPPSKPGACSGPPLRAFMPLVALCPTSCDPEPGPRPNALGLPCVEPARPEAGCRA